MNNKIFIIFVISICLNAILILMLLFWKTIALDYQQQILDLRKEIYEMNQTIETYKMFNKDI